MLSLPDPAASHSSSEMFVYIDFKSGTETRVGTLGGPLHKIKKASLARFSSSIKPRLDLLIPDVIQQVREVIRGIERDEQKKVVVTSTSSSGLSIILVHIVAILGAAAVVTLNSLGVWVGKELTGDIGEDGQKLFTLQLVAKVHEILMVTSLGQLVWSAVIRSLVCGGGLPFAVLGTGIRLPELSLLWSKELAALCLAKFRGKVLLLILIVTSIVLGVTVGPATATSIQPALTTWPAGSTPVVLNVSQDQLWPRVLDLTSPSRLTAMLEDSEELAPHWSSLASSFFDYWGQQYLGAMYAVPERASVPSPGSVRSIDVRFRGPFSLYQPLVTAATTQSVAAADSLTALRLLWDHHNTNICIWAPYRVRVTGDVCGYRDVLWTLRAQQPVVYTKCSMVGAAMAVTFPAIDRSGASASPHDVLEESDIDTGSSAPRIQWVSLEDGNSNETALGALVNVANRATSANAEYYACTVQAQWGSVEMQSSFLGTPFQVTGSPSDFYEPHIPTSRYRGTNVEISVEWASELGLDQFVGDSNRTALDLMLEAGAPNTISEGKVEAALAVAIAENMAWTHADAALSEAVPGQALSWQAFDDLAARSASNGMGSELTFDAAVVGFAYGIRTATGISTSALLSTIVLVAYICLSAVLVVMELWSRKHVHAWSNVTDLIALALNSSAGPSMHNTSVGVAAVKTLKLPVILQQKDGGSSVEMVVVEDPASPMVCHRPLRVDEAYG
ncbi:uncharacterized protein HMPREF1541_04629 [Cyphellophora europaea CBS 101466]|uniref:Uncharacterized protein n=1 Tax=Cyphellophora europaea (strain CBS 101466) TaxID=1220924 RepID=W2RV82_CYPE1|nr:uncharacterized protein HMPREF1541_04629 [Cyphellophora europaea CBS 101466]ETN40352.1 hypothetical protein HMPREF1541_04629 [Cyphellophora europaea CBS 101466]